MTVTFKVSPEAALNLDQFIGDTFPKALEFLNCLECVSGIDCEFQIESQSFQLPLDLDLEVNLEDRPNPIFTEAFMNHIREYGGQTSGFGTLLPANVAHDRTAIEGYLRNIDPEQWEKALRKSGSVKLFSSELVGGSAIGGGDL